MVNYQQTGEALKTVLTNHAADFNIDIEKYEKAIMVLNFTQKPSFIPPFIYITVLPGRCIKTNAGGASHFQAECAVFCGVPAQANVAAAMNASLEAAAKAMRYILGESGLSVTLHDEPIEFDDIQATLCVSKLTFTTLFGI